MKQLAALFAALLVFGCGGSGGSGGSGGGGGSISGTQRTAAIQSVQTQFAQIRAGGGDVDTQNQAIAAFMATMPEFEATGTEAEFDCAWGRFTDGRLLIVGNIPFPEGSTSPLRTPPPVSRSYIARPSKARLGHMFGPGFTQLQAPIVKMSQYLASENSYQVQSPPEGKLRLSDYRAVSGDGFVYFNSHGGAGKTRSGDTVFVMVSSTPHDAATDELAEVKADWQADRICYYVGSAGTVNGVETYGSWYGINYKFVQQYMSFGPNAIVFLNVCFTANPHLEVGRFRNAILNKGAAVVMGWTELCQSSSAFNAAEYFVDRLVASNTFRPENPNQRPFATNQVLSDMVRRNLARDGNSDLKATFRAGIDNVGLRSTIKLMLRDELNDYLVLHGDFGNETGVVRVNNVPAGLVGGWSDAVLITRIPESGPGSDGPVQVEVHGKKSNIRHLTSWRGTYTYRYRDSQQNSTLREDMTVNFHIRMDVDDYREAPGGDILEPDPRAFYAAGDSTLTWSCGGGITDEQGTYLSWQGGGTPAFVRRSILAPEDVWTLIGAYDPTTRKMVFGIACGGIKTVKHREGGDTYDMGAGGSYDSVLNADWTGPSEDDSQDDTVAQFTQLSVTWPPPNPMRKRGR